MRYITTAMINLSNISKSFGNRELFKNLNLNVGQNHRIALVGPNGTGKTTLFRIMLGESSIDSGTITRMKNLKIGYLPQEMLSLSGEEVLHTVLDSVQGYFETIQEKDRAQHELLILEKQEHSSEEERKDTAEKLVLRLHQLEEKLMSLGGESLKFEAMEILGGLGFSEGDMRRSLNTFSGGWHMRIHLAKILLNKPDLLLLDEPTNHLDLESIIWFEKYLQRFRGSIVMIAHDREFINRTASKIAEIRPWGLREYPGNYDRYLEMREEEENIAEKRYYEQQAEIRRIEEFIARNRVRKDRAAQVQSRFKMLEKMELLSLPVRTRKIKIDFKEPPRSTGLVIELSGMVKRYEDKTVFNGIDLSIYRGEKIALVGLNGAGKTTLLKILAGRIDFEGGKRVTGGNVNIDYFAQHQIEALNPDRTALQEMYSIADTETYPLVRGILGAFLFTGDDVEKKVCVLSGGEKSRLALARIMLKPANFLVMDEPTNHLDIASREVLEIALKKYNGTLCFTSHDRRFINEIATKVIEVENGILSHYPGNYDYYFYKKSQENSIKTNEIVNNKLETKISSIEVKKETEQEQEPEFILRKEAGKRRDERRKEAEKRHHLYMQLRPLKEKLQIVEEAIMSGEQRIKEIELQMTDPDFYREGEKTKAIVTEYDETKEKLKDLYDRWESLAREINAVEGN
jgi:ATP-binding cassette subfamily F protein 3